MWVLVGIVVIGLIAIFAFIARIGTLNNDPVQRELCGLILEMMGNGATPDAQLIFTISSTRAMMMAGLDQSQQQTRLAHALSMAKPLLNEQGYLVAHRIIRSIA